MGGTGLQRYLLVALGGALGSIARFWVGSAVADRMGMRFPYGTFVVNITACILIGFCMAFLDTRGETDLAWRFLVPIGFVGAYSTFSTFEWEAFSSLQTGAFFIASLYIVSSLFLGLFGVWLGVWIAKAIS